MKTIIISISIIIIATILICANATLSKAEGTNAVKSIEFANPMPFIAASNGNIESIKPLAKHEITLVELQDLATLYIPAQDPHQSLHLGSINGHFSQVGMSKTPNQLSIYKLNFK